MYSIVIELSLLEDLSKDQCCWNCMSEGQSAIGGRGRKLCGGHELSPVVLRCLSANPEKADAGFIQKWFFPSCEKRRERKNVESIRNRWHNERP